MPYPDARHVVTMTRVTTDTHEDHHVTAVEAIAERIARFREMKQPYTRDGMTLTYTDDAGAIITLTYQEPS
jgi:predicted membrane GTPase involved in stress response